MSRAKRNRDFVKSTGQQITKMPRSQTGEDESGNPIYEHLAEDETTVYAITTARGGSADRIQVSVGAREKEIQDIILSDQEDVGPNTKFRIGEFEYEVRQQKPAKVGLQRIQIERSVV